MLTPRYLGEMVPFLSSHMWTTTPLDTTNYSVPIVQAAQTTFWIGTLDVGPRTAQMFAFEPDPNNPWFYNCNITVSKVANATLPEHEISDSTAQIAAQAIALGGLDGKVQNNTKVHRTQRYPQRKYGFGALRQGNAGNMGFNIAHFAIGAISVADKFNPRMTFPGEEPVAGVSLKIPKVAYLVVIFVLVAGLQLFLLVVTSFMANRVIVTDDSPAAIARLLAPIVARVGDAGTIADGKKICEVLEKEDQMRVVYTVHRDEDSRARKRLVLSDKERERAMGNGRYD